MARAGEWEDVALRRKGGSRGFREDLSEITRTLVHYLRGVADFLAPPPPPRTPPLFLSAAGGAAAAAPSSSAPPSSRAMVGVRSDLAEIGGGFRTGFAALSCLLGNPTGKDGDDGGGKVCLEGSSVPPVVGINEEVLEFVKFLSARPEEWVQCPVPLDSHFEMSDVQKRHITSIEQLVPTLHALKGQLCPRQISEGTFWKIYLFLLHPKLSEHDSKLLSTVQIVEEMDIALKELRSRIIKRLENSRADAPQATSDKKCEIEEVDEQVPAQEFPNLQIASSSVDAIEKGNIDQWLEDVEFLTSHDIRNQLVSEDEVLLSDLECEDNLLGMKRHTSSSSLEVVHISPSGSCSEWVPLRSRSGLPPRSTRYVRPRVQERKVDGELSDWVDAGDSDSTLG